MHFTSENVVKNGVVERSFMLDGIPGILWTPKSTPAPLILLGHPGGLNMMYQRLTDRAKAAAVHGFASATIENPGSGERDRLPGIESARADLRRALEAGHTVTADIVDRLVLPLVDKSVPEWQAALDALLALPEIDGPVGYSGGVISVGTRLAAVEPRIAAAVLFAGSFIPERIFDDARRVTIPLHVLLPVGRCGQ